MVDKADKENKDDDAPKAEGEGAEGEGEEGLNPPKKKLGKKMIIIIAAAAVLLLGGGGAGLYFAGVFGGKAHEPAGEGAPAAAGHGAKTDAHGAPASGGEGEKAEGEGTAPKYYSLGDILVNLSGDGKRPNFLKIKVSLELANEKDTAVLETLKPRIIDNFQVYLRELRVEDLRGSAGLYRLREELLLRVTEVVQPVRVRDVLFQEMLVQ